MIPKKAKLDFNIEEDGANVGHSRFKQSKQSLQMIFEEEELLPLKKKKSNYK